MWAGKYSRVLGKVQKAVKRVLSCEAHDLDHVKRVVTACHAIAEHEGGVNSQVLELAAWMHDIARAKEGNKPGLDHAAKGARMARSILRRAGVRPNLFRRVATCIRYHRHRSSGCAGGHEPSIEEKILFDADKLDGTGAIGIGRIFAMGQKNGQSLYLSMPLDEYRKMNLEGAKLDGRILCLQKHAPNIEIQIKLEEYPKIMQTETGKRVARKRLEFMKDFLQHLDREVLGLDIS